MSTAHATTKSTAIITTMLVVLGKRTASLDDAKVGLKMWKAYFEWVEKNWLKWPEGAANQGKKNE